MPCYHPLHAVQSLTPNKAGVREISFKKMPSVPYGFEAVDLPCGQCIGCRLERSRQWALRCVHEADLHEDNSFITLTYSDDFLPKNGSLVKDDFQRFMKRLRKKVGVKIRFFHCGEYGSTTYRPHYHAILFGYQFPDLELLKVVNDVRVYTSELLAKVWGKGFVTVGEMTFESAAYVARYVLKKVNGPMAEKHYKGRLPEYVTMSRRPGIAHDWFRLRLTDVYPHDYVVSRGFKSRPPRYYDKLLGDDFPYTLETIKNARRAMAVLHADDSTPERLNAKEYIKMQQINLLPRSEI